LSEKTLTIDPIPPLEFFGVNERKLKTIAKYFPKLKLIARGQVLKLIGDEDSLEEFEARFRQFVGHYNKFGSLPLLEIERLLMSESNGDSGKVDESVLVYGPSGNLVRARTPNQKKIVEASEKDDMIFVIGPAGSGKTYTAVALAVRALKKREVKRIILTRPAVEAGESIGFLPGDMKELDPYLQPLYDALMDMLPPVKLAQYLETGVIQIAPLGFMRGRTLDHAFVILDEAQNATEAQTRMFLTRMGNSAKFIITGDVTQVDLPKKVQSGLRNAWNMLNGVKGISFIELGGSDIVRHPLVKRIVEIYAKEDDK